MSETVIFLTGAGAMLYYLKSEFGKRNENKYDPYNSAVNKNMPGTNFNELWGYVDKQTIRINEDCADIVNTPGYKAAYAAQQKQAFEIENGNAPLAERFRSRYCGSNLTDDIRTRLI